jgi:hypothetical protein
MIKILRRLEAEQREPKTVLAGRLAMTTASVAPVLGKDRDDLINKIDRRGRFRIFHHQWQRGHGSIPEGGADRSTTIRQRGHPARGVYCRQHCGLHLPRNISGDVGFRTSGRWDRGDYLLRCILAPQQYVGSPGAELKLQGLTPCGRKTP